MLKEKIYLKNTRYILLMQELKKFRYLHLESNYKVLIEAESNCHLLYSKTCHAYSQRFSFLLILSIFQIRKNQVNDLLFSYMKEV